MICPLCGSDESSAYHQDKTRSYRLCNCCNLVFVPPEHHLSPIEEKANYDLHDNQPDDPGYRNFLGRLFEPLAERIPVGAKGLDFGCGPGPTLSVMFKEAGHDVALYDAFYQADEAVFDDRYDFITLSEVAEHLSQPGPELERLWNCLKPGGWMGIMTKRVIDQEAFARWHYITDPTHVCFFSDRTFQWLAERWSAADMVFVGKDVVLFNRQ